MDLRPALVALLLVVVVGGESELRVSPGQNVILFCDLQRQVGVYIVWYRNCSHQNQSPLVLSSREDTSKWIENKEYSNKFNLKRNFSSETYDLEIFNVMVPDEGLYYCGTQTPEVKDEEHIILTEVLVFGNVTRLLVVDVPSDADQGEPGPPDPGPASSCWMLLFLLCPLSAAFSSLCSSLLVYRLCRKPEGIGNDPRSAETRGERSPGEGEDVCYAALDIRPSSQRPKRTKENADFSTYSAVKTSRK